MWTLSGRCVVVASLLLGPASAQQPLASVQGDEIGDAFGSALAATRDLDGDGGPDYIVGAPEAGAGGFARGKAWVFSGADHSVVHLFTGAFDERRLGFAVDGAGDVNGDGLEDLVVGEPWPVFPVEGPGHAFVYSGADGSVLHAFEGRHDGDLFGIGVAGVGDLDGDGFGDVAVGAPTHGADCISNCPGRVTVFSGADGRTLLSVPGWQPFMWLGREVGGYGDQDGDGTLDILVGAPSWGSDGSPFSPGRGAVVVLSGSTGEELVIGLGPGGLLKDSAYTGTTLGALGDLDGDGVNDFFGGGTEDFSGSLSLFSGATGAELEEIHVEGTDPRAAPLGDIDGDGQDDFLLTENGADGLAYPSGGSVHARGVAATHAFMIQRGTQANMRFGTTLAVLGDADGDGRVEYLAGGPGPAVATPQGPGRVQLFEFAPLAPWITVPGDGLTAGGFGAIARCAGDVDNDGAPDILTGEPADDTAAPDAGRARVHSGRDGSVLHEILGEQAAVKLGSAVDGAGDIDRDGFADFVVGIPFRPAPLPGAVRVYSGKTGAVLLEVEGLAPSDGFGASVAGVGDVNGDLVPDILVGAPTSSVGAAGGGSAVLISGADGHVLHAVHGTGPGLALGTTVGGGGDVDADGVPDLLVRVPNQFFFVPSLLPGIVRVLSGATGGLLFTLAGEGFGTQFGSALDDAGDVNGDGRADIVIGAPLMGPGFFPPGKAYVFSGAGGALLWSYAQPAGGANIGRSVAGMGDMNGDGRADVLVGAPRVDVLQGMQGEARLLSGADGSVLAAYAGHYGTTQLGTVVDRAGDFDLDGRSEVLVASLNAPDEPDGEISLWLSGDSLPWSNLGAVLPGTHGAPSLQVSGTLVAHDPVTLALGDALESAPAALVLGQMQRPSPFKGGTLVPQPLLVLTGLLTDPDGKFSVSGTWPSGVPSGQTVCAQFLVVDPAAPFGIAASNAVLGVAP